MQSEVDIVTPAKRLVDGAKSGSVKLPAVNGQLEILPGHTELLTLLTAGEISFHEDGQLKQFTVSHGFAEIRQDRVLILGLPAEVLANLQRFQSRISAAFALLVDTAPSTPLPFALFVHLVLRSR